MTYYDQSSEILEVWNFFIENAIFVDDGNMWQWYWYVPSDILQDNPIYVNGILIESVEWYYEIGGDGVISPVRFDLHGNCNIENFTISNDEMWLSLYQSQNIEVSVENGYGEFTTEQAIFIKSYITSFGDDVNSIPENFSLTINNSLPIAIHSTILNNEWSCNILLTNGDCKLSMYKNNIDINYIIYY